MSLHYFRDWWCFLLWFESFALVFALEKQTLSCYPFKTYFLFPTTNSLFQISMSYFLSGLIIHSFFFIKPLTKEKWQITSCTFFYKQVATKAHCKGECDQHGSEWPAAVPTFLPGAHSQVLNGPPHSGNHLWGKLISAFKEFKAEWSG